ncbi:hypothetical protein EDC01DRAFT_779068 [Geopyxis carbonaria]|nr:hypothetical protein EDC01DRAFT_779068 [Geopyxis carbonaria]
MAKVTAEALPWLSAPSTGHALFTQPPTSPPPPSTTGELTPSRLIATRGAELFFGRGNEVRCGDLQDLKARHPQLAGAASTVGHHAHRRLHLPELDWEIRALEVSGDGLYLAVAGETEVAVIVLPGEGFIKRDGRPGREGPLVVPHYRRVGRSCHNVDVGARVVRLLWHPLGVEGAALMVLTADGYLRSYEFLMGSEPSFELPESTFDLVAMRGGKRQGGYTADGDEMVPASMCFADGPEGWRPFTLYILMRGGDIYGLSPVVPSRWNTTAQHIQQLTVDITADLEDADETISQDMRTALRQQIKWINDVLNQRNQMDAAYDALATPKTCLTRPSNVGPTPALQGPFLFRPAPDEFDIDDCYAACDLFHIEVDTAGILGVIHSHGKLDLCIEPDALPAKWEGKLRRPTPTAELPVISGFQTLDLNIRDPRERNSENTNWPVFVRDVHSAHILFVQHAAGVAVFSMQPWIPTLQRMLADADESLLARASPTAVQHIVTGKSSLSGSAVLYEAYVGYLLLAAHASGVASVEFDEPPSASPDSATAPDDTFALLPATPRAPRQPAPRHAPAPSHPPAAAAAPPPHIPPVSVLQPPYTPSPSFSTPSQLPRFLASAKAQHGAATISGPFLFSTASNALLAAARATLKAEYDALMSGAQHLHDRAAAQRLEFGKQLKTLHAVDARLRELQERRVKERFERFLERQEELRKRADVVLRTLVVRGEVGLSDAERRWGAEVGKVRERVEGERGFGRRVEEVGRMLEVLKMSGNGGSGGKGRGGHGGEGEEGEVSEEVRRERVKGLFEMLRREGGVVESTRKRLEGLEVDVERA